MHSRLFCFFQGRFRPTSCVEYGQQGAYKDGIYKIYDNDGNSFPSYCDLKSEPGIAWTLVMSWSKKKSFYFCFSQYPISVQCPGKRELPQLGSLPLKSGANEITAGSLHPLASNMQLSDSWHRFHRLPPRQLQRLQHCRFPWYWRV